MMFIRRSGSQMKKWGVKPPVPTAIRALMLPTDEWSFIFSHFRSFLTNVPKYYFQKYENLKKKILTCRAAP